MRYLPLFLLLGGCATTSQAMNQLYVGMPKAEVIGRLGEPSSIKASGGTEILEYDFGRCVVTCSKLNGIDQQWVFIRDGRVYQYGRAGDFGTAAYPTQVIEHR